MTDDELELLLRVADIARKELGMVWAVQGLNAALHNGEFESAVRKADEDGLVATDILVVANVAVRIVNAVRQFQSLAEAERETANCLPTTPC